VFHFGSCDSELERGDFCEGLGMLARIVRPSSTRAHAGGGRDRNVSGKDLMGF
jgi:hypothetical protein